MKTDKPEKKGFFAVLKEAFTKSGGCCGAGETCGGPERDADNNRAQAKDAPKAPNAPVVREVGEAARPAQK